MMKRWIAMTLTLAMVLSFGALAQTRDNTPWAYSSEEGGLMLKYYSAGRGYLALYDGDDVLEIPATIEGTPVVSFSDYLLDFLTGKVEFKLDPDSKAFKKEGPLLLSADGETLIAVDRTAQGELDIPDGVETIGPNALRNCDELTKINLPASVSSIGNWAFEGCDGLTSFDIPDTVKQLGFGAFSKCKGLRAVSVPGSISELSERTFDGCLALTDVTLHEGLTTIGLRAFAECTALRTINLPRGLKTIGEEAFYGCTGLTMLAVPGSLSNIDEHAFYQCVNLEAVAMPADVSNISDSAFENCAEGLTLLVPDGSKAGTWAANNGVQSRKYTEADLDMINAIGNSEESADEDWE